MSYIDDMGLEIPDEQKPWPRWVKILLLVMAAVAFVVIYPAAALVLVLGATVLGLGALLVGGLLAMGKGTVR